ncbi:unnamed protein product [Periconia digitata]|uniref:Uncharacterized protein n=1 Tax=Periconia digitata TaxID=1303443 RepID=A0A9W4UR88_9PLEO|nr:unnamed protein product [Periconia digitata]
MPNGSPCRFRNIIQRDRGFCHIGTSALQHTRWSSAENFTVKRSKRQAVEGVTLHTLPSATAALDHQDLAPRRCKNITPTLLSPQGCAKRTLDCP